MQLIHARFTRALLAYKVKGYEVDTNPETGFFDHRLESLCAANKVAYDSVQSHGALYDTRPCMALFRKQHEVAPDLVEQMIINADSTTSHLLNDMLGVDTGRTAPYILICLSTCFAPQATDGMSYWNDRF